jgi:hypothetical protein
VSWEYLIAELLSNRPEKTKLRSDEGTVTCANPAVLQYPKLGNWGVSEKGNVELYTKNISSTKSRGSMSGVDLRDCLANK